KPPADYRSLQALDRRPTSPLAFGDCRPSAVDSHQFSVRYREDSCRDASVIGLMVLSNCFVLWFSTEN
ncbi:hypothetical protein LINGRAPRIM_LOCUS188, partial [Linum grandiflorum]